MSGQLFSSVVFGTMGDKLGRKISLMAAMLLTCSAQFVGAFMPEYVSYTFTRFITGLGSLYALDEKN